MRPASTESCKAATLAAGPHQLRVRRVHRSQKFTKLLHGQAGVTRNAAHRERVDWVVARNRHDALTVAHDDVLALTHDSESGLLECAHGVEVIDAWDLGQGLDSHFDFANFLSAQLLVHRRQVLPDCVFDVFYRLRLGGAL